MKHKKISRNKHYNTAMARGLSMATSFAASIASLTLLGWGVDKLAGTSPWMQCLGAATGFCVGILNLIRMEQRFQKE